MYCYDRTMIRTLLTQRGMSISDLHRALVRGGDDSARGPIADCVNGKRVPDADRIALIASVLDVAPAAFFFGGRVGVKEAVQEAEPETAPAAEVDPDEF